MYGKSTYAFTINKSTKDLDLAKKMFGKNGDKSHGRKNQNNLKHIQAEYR